VPGVKRREEGDTHNLAKIFREDPDNTLVGEDDGRASAGRQWKRL
jgi:hypothetical protein